MAHHPPMPDYVTVPLPSILYTHGGAWIFEIPALKVLVSADTPHEAKQRALRALELQAKGECDQRKQELVDLFKALDEAEANPPVAIPPKVVEPKKRELARVGR